MKCERRAEERQERTGFTGKKGQEKMNCNREGTWGAWPVSITINESGDNKLTAACIRFAIVQEAVGQEWRDLDDQMDLTGYWYFEKKDNSVFVTSRETFTGLLSKASGAFLPKRKMQALTIRFLKDLKKASEDGG